MTSNHYAPPVSGYDVILDDDVRLMVDSTTTLTSPSGKRYSQLKVSGAGGSNGGSSSPSTTPASTLLTWLPTTVTSGGNTSDIAVSSSGISVDIDITALTGAAQFFIDRKGVDNVYYPVWQSVPVTSTTLISTAIGAVLTYAQCLGSTIRLRWTAGTSLTFSASIISIAGSIVATTLLSPSSTTVTANGSTADLVASMITGMALDINVTSISGTAQFFLDRKGSDGNYYPIWQSVPFSATRQISTSIGAGFVYAQNLGATLRLRWAVGTTLTFSNSLVGIGSSSPVAAAVLSASPTTWTANGSTTDIAVGAFTGVALDINVTVITGTAQFFLDRKGSDGSYYPVWQSLIVTAASLVSTSIGVGLVYPQCLGTALRLRWTVTTSITFSASMVGR